MDEELLRIIDLFDDDEVTTADKIDRPAAASYREMFDDFNARNPFAGGGRINFDEGSISLKKVNQYRKQGLTAKDISEKLNVGLSKYEEFLTKNKSKLVKVSPKKITDPERIKALGMFRQLKLYLAKEFTVIEKKLYKKLREDKKVDQWVKVHLENQDL